MITGSLFSIYASGLLLGVAAGFFMHRSDYCVAGMFRDAFLFKNTFMLRVLFLQIVVTMVIFEMARLAGFLPLYPFPLLGAPSLASVIGGFVFGVGMVMAGGCVVGTLYKLGAGSIVSGAAFLGLIIGSGVYAEIHPFWAWVIKNTTIFHKDKTLPQVLDVSPMSLVGIIVMSSLVLFFKWSKEKKWHRNVEVRGYLQPWKAAVFLSIIGLLSYILVGMPLGVSTTYAKMAAMFESIFSADHVSNVAFFQLIPLNISHPYSGAVMKGGPGPLVDAIWAIQFPVIFGIVFGSGLSAILLKEFSIHYKVPVGQLIMALGGGVLLGISSRMTTGCNVWHLMGGLPIMAMQSILFLVGIIPGSWVGGRIVSRVILR